eukprot:13741026-Alexandrium_andersonii.AAC.1
MAARYRSNPHATSDPLLSDAERLAMWEELFLPLLLEHVLDDWTPPPFTVEPYRLRAAAVWGCPSHEIEARVAVHLPECGLCREYEMFLNHYERRWPGSTLIPTINPLSHWPD